MFVLLDLKSYDLWIVVCPFVLFLLAIVLSVLLRFTNSDYPSGIFKLCLVLITSQERTGCPSANIVVFPVFNDLWLFVLLELLTIIVQSNVDI